MEIYSEGTKHLKIAFIGGPVEALDVCERERD